MMLVQFFADYYVVVFSNKDSFIWLFVKLILHSSGFVNFTLKNTLHTSENFKPYY